MTFLLDMLLDLFLILAPITWASRRIGLKPKKLSELAPFHI